MCGEPNSDSFCGMDTVYRLLKGTKMWTGKVSVLSHSASRETRLKLQLRSSLQNYGAVKTPTAIEKEGEGVRSLAVGSSEVSTCL